MIKYEDVEKLAGLQAEIIMEERRADLESTEIDYTINWLTRELAELNEERDTIRHPFKLSIKGLNNDIDDTKNKIVDDWDDEEKTTEYELGTLRLTTRKKLVIGNKSAMMADLINHIEPERVIDYVKTFDTKKLTEYMGTFPQPPEVAEIVATTTASFRNK